AQLDVSRRVLRRPIRSVPRRERDEGRLVAEHVEEAEGSRVDAPLRVDAGHPCDGARHDQSRQDLVANALAQRRQIEIHAPSMHEALTTSPTPRRPPKTTASRPNRARSLPAPLPASLPAPAPTATPSPHASPALLCPAPRPP